MAKAINLNADMGEGFGAWDMGDDASLMKIIRSASIACGFHAGDPVTMHRLVRLAAAAGVSIGAHPGFNDLWGFGRRRIDMSPRELEYMIAYQIGALQAMAAYVGQKVTHVKVHGALNNMAAEDIELALAIGRAMKTVDRDMIYVALAGSQMEKAAQELGLPLAREGFCDRLYDDDGNLTSRKIAGCGIARRERDPRPGRQHGAERRDRLAHRQEAEGPPRHLVPARRRALGGDRRARRAPGPRSRRRRDRHLAGNAARLRFQPG